jgi:hypothetical protein
MNFISRNSFIASFEPVAGRAEDAVLPTYRAVLKERRLDGTPTQKAALAFLVAFQLLRTKAHRDRWKSIEEATVKMVKAHGGKMQDVKGWEPETEDTLKRNHLLSIQGALSEFTAIIAGKDFVLAEPAEGRTFYLGDNPVVMANSRDFGPYGNLGLAVLGIEIYMPLAADLL